MKLLQKIFSRSILVSLLAALFITIVFSLIWKPPIEKYKIEVNPFIKGGNAEKIWFFDDFDGDGNTEYIRCQKENNAESLDIIYYDQNGNLKENYHYRRYEWHYWLEPKIFDIDKDGVKELLYFSTRNDSIFFSAVNLLDFKLKIDHLYFNEFEKHAKNYSCRSVFYYFGDFNNDGVEELFFNFDAGFGLYPRGIFKMEFPSLKITNSPTEYMCIKDPILKDINKDGVPEIFTHTHAPSNCTYSEKYSDTCSYITVLTYDLNFLFPPIAMYGNYSGVFCIPSQNTDSTFFAVYNNKSDSLHPNSVLVLNKNGKIMQRKTWQKLSNPENSEFKAVEINNVPYLLIDKVGRYRLTDNLEFLPKNFNSSSIDQYDRILCVDLNKDRVDESLRCNRFNEIIIDNEKDNTKNVFKSPIPINKDFHVYPVLKDNEIHQYAFTTLGGFFLFNYNRNKNYYFLYFIYLSVFILATIFIRSILYTQEKNMKKQWQTEKQLSELQFNSVKNQLNPHFLFNTLNSVAYMINQGQKDEAYNFLSINSRMIQRMMDDSNLVKRTLKNEIQFTKDYINIQQHRFKGRFQSEFLIHPDVDLKFEVPKMCIHTYVENAIKHGFRETKSKGILKIQIETLNNGVSISVADNGMGRKAAAGYKDSSGNGLKIMQNFYTLFEKYHEYKISCDISDNPLPGEKAGTSVKLTIIRTDT